MLTNGYAVPHVGVNVCIFAHEHLCLGIQIHATACLELIMSLLLGH